MPHPYRPNHSTVAPTQQVFLEIAPRHAFPLGPNIEARAMRLWTASSVRLSKSLPIRRKTGSGETTAEFLRWLSESTSLHHATWVWSHGAMTDWTQLGLWDAIDSGILHLEDVVLGGPPNILFCSLYGRTVIFVDSLNWFRESIADLGEIAGLTPSPRPSEGSSESDVLAWANLNRDILESTVLSMIRWVKESHLGMLRHTAPSQSLASWRHIHKGPWPEPHEQPVLSAHEREAYCGGRADLGYQGIVRSEYPGLGKAKQDRRQYGAALYDTSSYVYDATAFYPSMMKGRKYPYRFSHALDSTTPDGLLALLDTYGVISRVLIRSEENVYPVRRNNQVYYAKGEFATTLAGPELTYALLAGDVAKVGFTTCYQMADLFTPWVDRLWALREQFERESNRPWTGLVKLIMNSLYGKFTQREGGWVNVPAKKNRPRWGVWLEAHKDRPGADVYRSIAGKQQKQVPLGEHPRAIVSIGAYVTAYGRVLGREWRENLPPNTLLYSDTDSLHVTKEGHFALERSGLLGRQGIGALKLKKIVPEAEYRNVKLYRLGSEVYASGIHQENPLEGQFPSMQVIQEGFENLIRRARDGTVRVETQLLTLAPRYTHGTVGKDGFTIPFDAPCAAVPTYPAEPSADDQRIGPAGDEASSGARSNSAS